MQSLRGVVYLQGLIAHVEGTRVFIVHVLRVNTQQSLMGGGSLSVIKFNWLWEQNKVGI